METMRPRWMMKYEILEIYTLLSSVVRKIQKKTKNKKWRWSKKWRMEYGWHRLNWLPGDLIKRRTMQMKGKATTKPGKRWKQNFGKMTLGSTYVYSISTGLQKKYEIVAQGRFLHPYHIEVDNRNMFWKSQGYPPLGFPLINGFGSSRSTVINQAGKNQRQGC